MNCNVIAIFKSSLPFSYLAIGGALLGAAGCASVAQPLHQAGNAEALKTCEISPKSILPWREFNASEQRQVPYTVKYEGCGRTLYYVAANHTNAPDSKTYQAIGAVFNRDDIDVVIVEGFPSQMGISPAKMITYANNVENSPADSEPYYSIRQAIAFEAEFLGGEPMDSDILSTISNDGVSAIDLLGFYIVRQIPQLIRSETLSDHRDPRLENEIFNIVGSFAQSTQMPIETFKQIDGLEPFLEWYRNTNGVGFYEGFRAEDAWPASALADPRGTNRLSDHVADARDQHIIGIIGDTIGLHQTVLVVYGGSHHAIHAPALEAAFAKSDVIDVSAKP